MFCIHCGKKIKDDSNFCIFCGKQVYPASGVSTEDNMHDKKTEEPVKERLQDRSDEGKLKESFEGISAKHVSEDSERKRLIQDTSAKKISGIRKKKVILISALAIFLIIVTGISFVLVSNQIRKDKYSKAVVMIEKKNFKEAKKLFEQLKGYKDSQEKLQECQNNLDYERALSLLEAEDYEQARDEFAKLRNFKESEEKYELCLKGIDYNEGIRLIENKEYQQASILFEGLGDFKDSVIQFQICRDHLDYEKAEELLEAKKYKEAKPLYSRLSLHDFEDSDEKYLFCLNKEKMRDAKKNLKKGRYYEAYKRFKDLGEFENADKKLKDCIKKFPGTRELYRNKKYKNNSLSLTIVPPKDGSKNIIKIYNQNDEIISLITISKNSRYTVRLPAGNYKIKNGYGYDNNNWFGEKDLFGDEGNYFSLMNSNYQSETFVLKRGYIYTLTLRSNSETTGDSVQTKRESPDNF